MQMPLVMGAVSRARGRIFGFCPYTGWPALPAKFCYILSSIFIIIKQIYIMELYITRYGSKIAVNDGAFEVSWFDDQKMLQKESHSPLKVKCLWIQEGSMITVSAVLLALQHGIDVLMLDGFGMPQGRCDGYEMYTTPSVQKAQVLVSVSSHAVDFVRNWTAQKLGNQADFLEKLKSRRDSDKQQLLEARAKDIRKLRKQLLTLHGQKVPDIAESLRGLEGTAGRLYFQTLSDVLPEEYRFGERSRQPARDPFNAFLNYGYAILYGMVEKALRLAGLNPAIGFLHRDGHQTKGMLYDFIEPFRVWIDQIVFRLFSRKNITSAHTEVVDGGLFLNGAGKKVLAENTREFFDERKESMDGNVVSRERFLRMSASRFAQRLLQIAELGTGGGIAAIA